MSYYNKQVKEQIFEEGSKSEQFECNWKRANELNRIRSC